MSETGAQVLLAVGAVYSAGMLLAAFLAGKLSVPLFGAPAPKPIPRPKEEMR